MEQNRRQFVLGGAMAGLGLSLTGLGEKVSFAAEAKKKNTGSNAELVAAVSECIRAGEACAAHCAKELAGGNTMFAKCAQTVDDMLVLCRSLQRLASKNSVHLTKLANVCIDGLDACIEACGEHKAHFSQGKHLECKACLEACENCEKTCKKTIELG